MQPNTTDSLSGGYSSIVDSELGTLEDNTVITINAHLDDPEADDRPDQYNAPEVTVQTLETIRQQLATLNREELATVIQTKLLQLDDNRSPLYFSARELSEIVIALTIGLAKSQFCNEADSIYAITQFGKAIAWGIDGALLAESAQHATIPRVKPTDTMSYIDPFAVIACNQSVVFTDEQGNELEAGTADE